jgi:hypothetical protein
LFGDFDEFAVVKGLGFERLNLRVDQGHRVSDYLFKKAIEVLFSIAFIIKPKTHRTD